VQPSSNGNRVPPAVSKSSSIRNSCQSCCDIRIEHVTITVTRSRGSRTDGALVCRAGHRARPDDPRADPHQLHVLREKPNYSGAPGHARVISPADIELSTDWTTAFMRQAVPHDPPPSRDRLAQIAAEGSHQFWIVDGKLAAMAGIVGRTRNGAAIAGVYTPLSLRGRSYAGWVTAAVVERIFIEAKAAACLSTDLRNPASNCCYAKIGFEPACRSGIIREPDASNDEVCRDRFYGRQLVFKAVKKRFHRACTHSEVTRVGCPCSPMSITGEFDPTCGFGVPVTCRMPPAWLMRSLVPMLRHRRPIG
jgi:RimJ/RimL family protein N-acetyltransferase